MLKKMNKQLVLISEDNDLISVIKSSMDENFVHTYPFTHSVNDIDYNETVVIVDHDALEVGNKQIAPNFLENLVIASGPEVPVIVLGTNCDRKNVSSIAKKGTDRFIVKPLNKKRFKRLIMPYIEVEELLSETSEDFSTSNNPM
jgi:FixJ family two-component response regulator